MSCSPLPLESARQYEGPGRRGVDVRHLYVQLGRLGPGNGNDGDRSSAPGAVQADRQSHERVEEREGEGGGGEDHPVPERLRGVPLRDRGTVHGQIQVLERPEPQVPARGVREVLREAEGTLLPGRRERRPYRGHERADRGLVREPHQVFGQGAGAVFEVKGIKHLTRHVFRSQRSSTKMTSQPGAGSHVCPWWLAYTFDNPLRRLAHDAGKILSPYLREGMTAVDLGCGMGYFSIAMAGIVGNQGTVISVDIQKEMLAVLRRRAEKAGVMDIARTPAA